MTTINLSIIEEIDISERKLLVETDGNETLDELESYVKEDIRNNVDSSFEAALSFRLGSIRSKLCKSEDFTDFTIQIYISLFLIA